MCKAAGLTFLSLELINKFLKPVYHFVVIASIVASDTQDLMLCE